MPEHFIPYGRQWIDDDDVAAVAEALRADWLTQGPTIAEFERAVAARVGAKHGVAFTNGTAALHAACFAAGIGPGDEVITSPITFVASANCALYLGARIAFADIRPDTYCLDPEKLESAITPATKAIVAVDHTGQPCDLDEIRAIAKQHRITLIEDAAHALGATYRGRPVGALSDMTMFSFHPVKHITTGEGGMITTEDDDLARKMRVFRTHGISRDAASMSLGDQAADNVGGVEPRRNPATPAPWYYEMQALGFNYRITDVQCALGLSQLKKLDRSLERRREISRRYTEAFANSRVLVTPYQEPDRESAWHLYVIRLRLEAMAKTRRQVFEDLRHSNIGVNVHYVPVHLQPYFRERFGFTRGDFPEAEAYYDGAITIPLHPTMTDADCERVIDAVVEAVS